MKSIVYIRVFSLLAFTLLIGIPGWSQCSSGEVGITTASGGCMSGCNLTAFGGPNCDGVTGNTPSAVTATKSITVPNGCTFTVTATMMNRTGGCSASGADAGDGMKVDVSGGAKALKTGSSNATLTDSYTLAGPGTIVVTCTANRRDEIVTYSMTSSGSACTNCTSVLPVELLSFTAEAYGDYVDLNWITQTERKNNFFTIERSADGKTFDEIGRMPGAGTVKGPINYTNRDVSPLGGISYYRLKQTDYNGHFEYFNIVSVQRTSDVAISPNPVNEYVSVSVTQPGNKQIRIMDAVGKEVILDTTTKEDGQLVFDTRNLQEGVYFVAISSGNEENIVRKIVVRH